MLKYNQSMLVFNKLHPIDKSKIINILEKYKKFILLKIIFHQMDYMILYKLIVNSNATFKIKSFSPEDYDLKVGTNIKYF